MQDLDQLAIVLPPPIRPVESTGMDWKSVEEELGTRLPYDYKSYVEQYGSGRIDGFLWVYNPNSECKYTNLLTESRIVLGYRRDLAASFDFYRQYPLFPDAGGLLPFGGTDNGNDLFWVTRGEPNQWSVVVGDARGPQMEEFACGVVAFLVGFLTGRIVPTLLPEPQHYVPAFEPAKRSTDSP